MHCSIALQSAVLCCATSLRGSVQLEFVEDPRTARDSRPYSSPFASPLQPSLLQQMTAPVGHRGLQAGGAAQPGAFVIMEAAGRARRYGRPPALLVFWLCGGATRGTIGELNGTRRLEDVATGQPLCWEREHADLQSTSSEAATKDGRVVVVRRVVRRWS